MRETESWTRRSARSSRAKEVIRVGCAETALTRPSGCWPELGYARATSRQGGLDQQLSHTRRGPLHTGKCEHPQKWPHSDFRRTIAASQWVQAGGRVSATGRSEHPSSTSWLAGTCSWRMARTSLCRRGPSQSSTWHALARSIACFVYSPTFTTMALFDKINPALIQVSGDSGSTSGPVNHHPPSR